MIEFQVADEMSIPEGTIIERQTPFQKRWRLRNSGQDRWQGCRLVYTQGTIAPVDLNRPLPPLNPGEEITIPIDMISPAEPGQHSGSWAFHDDSGQPVGEPLILNITVAASGPLNGRLLSIETAEQPGFAVVESGRAFTQTITVENSGGRSWSAADQLVFMGGDATPAEHRLPLAALNPGERQAITLTMTAGSKPSDRHSYWRLRSGQGGYFGGVITTTFEIVPAADPPPPAAADPQSWRETIWGITGVFESGRVGGNPAALQTHDEGIVSYGKHQATLQSGNLAAVLERYVERSRSAVAGELQRSYLNRVQQRDPALRHDQPFHDLLRQAAADPEMIAAQDDLFARHFYNPAVARAAELGIRSPLGHACLYDTRIQHGSGGADFIVKLTSDSFQPPPAVSGVDEAAWLAAFLNEREALLNRLADKRDAEADQTADHGRQNSLRLTAKALRISTFRAQELRTLLTSGNLQLTGPFTVRGLKVDGLS